MINIADRQSCHQDEDVTKEKCKAKGCCWQPNTDSAWCFHPMNGNHDFHFLGLLFDLN